MSLIDRQAAIDALYCTTPTEPYIHIDDAVKAINGVPEEQSEIIHCRDCKHCYIGCDDRDNQYYSCTVKFDEQGFWNEVMSDDFCSWAGKENR